MGRFSVVIAVMLALGCNGEPRRGTDSDVSFPEAQALLERGPRRLELSLSPEGGVSLARSFEIESDDELLHDEEIEAELLAFAELDKRGACRGTLTFDVPGLEVQFDSAVTRFSGPDEAPGCTAFVEYVRERLAEGRRIRLEARRRPARVPQDPDDRTFFAELLRLVDDDADDSRAVLELNVGPEHLTPCARVAEGGSDCEGALTIFGAPLVTRRGMTDIEVEDPTELLIYDLEERVVAVDVRGDALILENGTALRVVDGTRFDGDVRVADARDHLARGGAMKVEGEAVLSARAPMSLIGIELELHAMEPDEDDELEPESVALSGRVMAVEPRIGRVMLPFDTEVLVDAMTVLDGELDSLDTLERLLDAGHSVRAEVLGVREPPGDRAVVVRADRLTLRHVRPLA